MIPARTQALRLVVALLVIQALDVATAWQIHDGTIFGDPAATVIMWVDVASTVVFVGLAVALVVAMLHQDGKHVERVALVYLSMALVQVTMNVVMLVGTGHARDDSVLWGMWDLGACYVQLVAVFTGWYYLADNAIRGGAFNFPRNNDGSEYEPNIVDYVFIAFNTNATFGPTSEAVVSRRVKVLMMVQALLSLSLIVVFVSRIVALFT